MMNTRLLLSVSLSYLLTTSAFANDDRFKDVEITPQQLTETSYMFTGSGGNIGVSAGSDGILIIDNQFAPLADKISAALSKIQTGKPKYVVNTHYHGDHTGGNNLFGIDGVILAHHNVLSRLSGNTSYTPEGLPSITYHEGINIHFNGENLQLLHMGRATLTATVLCFGRTKASSIWEIFSLKIGFPISISTLAAPLKATVTMSLR